MSYFVGSTVEEQRQMLETLGVSSVEELFDCIPAHLRTASFDLPQSRPENEVLRHIARLSSRNRTDLINFCGGGYYEHHIPAAVDALTSRGEFFTAYTPYQAEASQGTLQAMFEFQTAVVRLTGMEVANASLYDGGSALFEAVMMSMRITRRDRILVDTAVNPIHRKMLQTYAANTPARIVEIPHEKGRVSRRRMEELLDEHTAAVVVQNPNFFGCVDDFTDLARAAHQRGALLVVSFYPVSLGLLKSPGEMGADIAVGEGQSLGLPLSFGGPYLGLMATRRKYIRQMPGRIVGATQDAQGRTGYVLTLQAREQHIRREKATSNICTNEGLCALRAIIFLALLGPGGLRNMALTCARRAAEARDRLSRIPGVSFPFEHPVFNEFVIELPADARDVCQRMFDQGILPGIPLADFYPGMERCLLVAVTEQRTEEDLQRLAESLQTVLSKDGNNT